MIKTIFCEDSAAVAIEAAKQVAECVKAKPDCVLGLATGSTPVGMYNELARMCSANELDFNNVKSYNLDEYYPIAADDEQSYHYFMQKNLFEKINIKPENTHLLDGTVSDPEKECADYDAAIKAAGGIDLQILGIGQNGHIAFNEPDIELYCGTHLTDLTESTIAANSRFFENEAYVPRKALTMGMGSILAAKKIVILACGENKRDAVAGMFGDKITTANPSSFLKLHHDVVLICDKSATPKF